MVLGKVIKLDYKNRCHLPIEMMEAVGISPDSEVEISCTEGTNEILIKPRDPKFIGSIDISQKIDRDSKVVNTNKYRYKVPHCRHCINCHEGPHTGKYTCIKLLSQLGLNRAAVAQGSRDCSWFIPKPEFIKNYDPSYCKKEN